MKAILLSAVLVAGAACTFAAIENPVAKDPSFSWDGATVYFLITDRFCNGDTLNDVNYGRITDYGSERMNAATFHGGDFRGLLLESKRRLFQGFGRGCSVDDGCL